jgi:putative hydrolase of the HAD superfamily
LFVSALQALELDASQAIAFEDSPNGVHAARAAGLFVVAVPNPTTARLKIEGANLTVPSLQAFSLDELLARIA